MPDATITSTASTFGTISGTFAADQSTVTGTVTAIIPGTLSGSVGGPGPQGPAGATGPQGPAGEGVPAGGTAGQVLAKVDGVDYNTEWINVDVSAKRDLTDYDFTNVADEKIETFGLNIQPNASSTIPYDSYLSEDRLRYSYDVSDGGTVEGAQLFCEYTDSSFQLKRQDWASDGTSIVPTLNYGAAFNALNGLKFINWDNTTQASTMQYGRTSITFPNSTVQTIAFPGFNNAALTGNPTAPTAALGDNDTSIATTAFVQQELLSGTANAKNLEVYVRNQTGSTLAAGTIVYVNGATGNRPTVTPAQANNDATSAQTIGFVKTSIANNGFGYVIVRGELENINTSALTEGVQLYLSPTTAGTWTTTKPSAPQHLVYVGIVIRSHPTLGVILVSVQNGYELNELHDVALASEANNDLLVYESSTDLWKNKSFSTLGLATQSYVTSQGYITSSALTGYATESWVTTALGSYLTTATAASTYQTQAGMSSYLTTSAAASTYLTQSNAATTYYPLSSNPAGYLTSAPVTSVAGKTGAVTLDVADVSGAAPLASPTFTGTPSLPTGTTAVTQAAGNNTTAVATTAFVQQEVPAASTTAAGKVELATNAEALVQTSSTLAITADDIPWGSSNGMVQRLDFINSTAVSGSGSVTTAYAGYRQVFLSTAGSAGRASFSAGVPGTVTVIPGLDNFRQINFSKKIWLCGKFAGNVSGTAGDANNFYSVSLGGYTTATTGAMTAKGIGLKKTGGASSVIELVVHNGTSQTVVATTKAIATSEVVEWMIYSDGTGNVTLYINGTSSATSSAGPTGATADTAGIYREQVEQTASAATRMAVNSYGGQIIIER